MAYNNKIFSNSFIIFHSLLPKRNFFNAAATELTIKTNKVWCSHVLLVQSPLISFTNYLDTLYLVLAMKAHVEMSLELYALSPTG